MKTFAIAVLAFLFGLWLGWQAGIIQYLYQHSDQYYK